MKIYIRQFEINRPKTKANKEKLIGYFESYNILIWKAKGIVQRMQELYILCAYSEQTWTILKLLNKYFK